ncbi:helix-turn-helix transcriptional regulator [Iningainema tapete]|uniref:LuxR family transcriptional regulator n=1 Tax=Iningainema tapete BLCC-T55 TaxID=2748662 RepID=A0A8J6XWN2_9CYAN|nr:LuxR C-terminal-related transcriptional regulator [Iningainema tapete]MBD2777772.1 LuxR family transcriptional regulator [Iningainema tapete BLCC-T55]
MAYSLQSLFEAIAHTPNEQELRLHVMARVGEYFAAQRWGLFFFDEFPQNIQSIALSTKHNPVLRYVVEHHAPIHEELLLPPGAWRLICPRQDHGHVMAGPIVNNSQLVGGIGLTRDRDAPAFNAHDLANLSALCLHLSTWLVTTKSPAIKSNSINIQKLTPREIQIAQLVAQGLTNAEIGKALWITENSVKQALKRMFRKLEISSRAEMVARLYS